MINDMNAEFTNVMRTNSNKYINFILRIFRIVNKILSQQYVLAKIIEVYIIWPIVSPNSSGNNLVIPLHGVNRKINKKATSIAHIIK